MHYQIKPGEPFQSAFNRISAKELAVAIDLLAAKGADPTTVHDVRKSLKRMRSLLRLARPVLGGEVFRCENSRLREAAASLSGTRDAEVMLQTLDLLNVEATGKKGRLAAISSLRGPLQQRRDDEAARLSPARLAETIDLMRDARESLANLRFEKDRRDPLAAGLAATLRQAQRNFRAAYDGGGEHEFHDLRKSVQHYYRQMQLFADAWPQLFDVLIEEAKQLADVLGEEHDLSVLREHAQRHRKLLAGKRALDTLTAAIAQRQQGLQEQARERCRRLFMTEEPQAFARHIVSYGRPRQEPAGPTR